MPPQLNCKGLGTAPGHSLEFPSPCSHPLVLCSKLGTGSINNQSRNADPPRQPALISSVCAEMNPPDHQIVTLKHPRRSVPGGLENIHTLWGSKQPLEPLREEARATGVGDQRMRAPGPRDRHALLVGSTPSSTAGKRDRALTLSHLCLSRALTLSHRKGDNEAETKTSSKEKTRPLSLWLTGNPHRCPPRTRDTGQALPPTPTRHGTEVTVC